MPLPVHLAHAGPNWEIYGHWQPEWNTDPLRIRTDVFYQVAPKGHSENAVRAARPS